MFSKLSFVTLKQHKEFLTTSRRYVMEQIKDKRLGDTVRLNAHLGKILRVWTINSIRVDFMCKLGA